MVNPYDPPRTRDEEIVRAELVPFRKQPMTPAGIAVITAIVTLLAAGAVYGFIGWLQWVSTRI